jgi:hypothetical protein
MRSCAAAERRTRQSRAAPAAAAWRAHCPRMPVRRPGPIRGGAGRLLAKSRLLCVCACLSVGGGAGASAKCVADTQQPDPTRTMVATIPTVDIYFGGRAACSMCPRGVLARQLRVKGAAQRALSRFPERMRGPRLLVAAPDSLLPAASLFLFSRPLFSSAQQSTQRGAADTKKQQQTARSDRTLRPRLDPARAQLQHEQRQAQQRLGGNPGRARLHTSRPLGDMHPHSNPYAAGCLVGRRSRNGVERRAGTWNRTPRRGRPPRVWCPVPGICACARLKRRAAARLGAAAIHCGACWRPLCGGTAQAPAACAGGSAGACTMRFRAASSMEGTRPCSGGRGTPRCEMGILGTQGSPRRGPSS